MIPEGLKSQSVDVSMKVCRGGTCTEEYVQMHEEFVRGRRPVADSQHGRLIGLLDRDVSATTTTLLLLLP